MRKKNRNRGKLNRLSLDCQGDKLMRLPRSRPCLIVDKL